MTIAIKKDPELWRRSKELACKKGKLCPHSARKMQWATRYYKAHGGRYVGSRDAERNSMARWTRQRWRTSDGRRSEGKRRYLPDASWKRLSRSQIVRTNRAKARGTARGRQWVKQPRDVVMTLRRSKSA